ncbi:WH1-domain-containing protein, partial [Ramicandelaber brevisporus]
MTISADEKKLIKSVLPSSAGNKIYSAAVARVYYADRGQPSWYYTNVRGALVFVKDSTRNGAYFLRVVDLLGKRGVLWEHELPENSEYVADTPFFHSFAGDRFMIGFDFCDPSDASKLHRKVSSRDAGD